MTLLISLIITYSIPILILTLCVGAGFLFFKKRGSSGQAEMVISVALILLAAGSVVAYTAYNSTINSSFTGNFLAVGVNGTQNETPTIKIIEKTKTIEVWANTSLELGYLNDSINARLLLDNGFPPSNQTLNFYLNDSLLGSKLTDIAGYTEIELTLEDGTHVIIAEFLGNGEEYLNRAQAEIQVTIGLPEEENETWLNVDLSIPQEVTRGENLSITATVSGFNVTNIALDLILPEDFELLSGSKTIICDVIDSCINNLLVSTVNASLGEKEVTATASSGNLSISKTKTINVTENITQPEIKILKIEAPDIVNQSEEFEVKVFVTSLYGSSADVNVKLEAPPEIEILDAASKEACSECESCGGCDSVPERAPIKSIPEINENETAVVAWRAKANLVGNYTLTAYAESQKESRDNRTFRIEVLYLIPTGITYDPVTDTVEVISDGKTCTAKNPCGFSDIHYVNQLNGWGKVRKIGNYFSFDANLVVGDGEKETWFYSESESIYFRKPVEVLRNGNLRFGQSVHDLTSRGSFIQTDVSPESQLIEDSAFLIRSGGALHLYGSSYKVFNELGENNIYCEDGSHLFIERFTLQRAEGSGEVILYAPQDAEISDLLVVKGGKYIRKTGAMKAETMKVLESRTEGYVE